MRLSHNLPSLDIYTGYSKSIEAQQKAMNRISSGLKITSAKDNPDGMSKSEKLNMQIRGLQMANKNLQDGASMLQTTEGGLNEISSSLQRIRELTVQAASGTMSDSDKATIQSEINQMTKGIDDLAGGSSFNGRNLIDGSNVNPVLMAIGANPNDTLTIPTYNLKSDSIGDGTNHLKDINVTTNLGAGDALKVIDAAISTVVTARSKYGALENRMESGQNSTNEISDRLTTASSEITDADIAAEMVELSKSGIMQQAGTAMMVQTNKFPQDILKILDNIR